MSVISQTGLYFVNLYFVPHLGSRKGCFKSCKDNVNNMLLLSHELQVWSVSLSALNILLLLTSTFCLCSFHVSQNLLSCLRPSPPANMSRPTSIWAQTAAAICAWSCWTRRASVQWVWCPPCPRIHPVMVAAFSGALLHFLPPPPRPHKARRTSTWSWVHPKAPAARLGTRVPR